MNSVPKLFHVTHHRHKTKHRPADTSANVILCGRGKGLDNLPGNVRFRQILRKYAASYNAPGNNRKDKSLLLQYIRDYMIHHENMKFHKRDDEHDALKPLTAVEIKHKISHALRDINRSQITNVSNMRHFTSLSKKSNDVLLENFSGESKTNVEKEEEINEVLTRLNEPLPFDLPSINREDNEQVKTCNSAYRDVVTNTLEHCPDNTLIVKGWKSDPKLNISNYETIDNEKVDLEEEHILNKYNNDDHFDLLMTRVDDIWSDINSSSAPF